LEFFLENGTLSLELLAVSALLLLLRLLNAILFPLNEVLIVAVGADERHQGLVDCVAFYSLAA
jgi:hypothetical protein